MSGKGRGSRPQILRKPLSDVLRNGRERKKKRETKWHGTSLFFFLLSQALSSLIQLSGNISNDLSDCAVHRQEKLEQLAARFDRKAGMRETWLSENQRLVSQDNFGADLAAVEAATKKHEAIETDINAYEERVSAVVAVASELEQENYHDIDRINARSEVFLLFFFLSKLAQFYVQKIFAL